MMRRSLSAVVAAVGLVMGSPAARAHVVLEATLNTAQETPTPFLFTATLDTTQEVPPTTVGPPSPTGTAKFALNADKTLRYEFTTQNLSGTALAAHLHESPPGASNPNPAVLLDETTGKGTTSPLTDDQVDALRAGNLYINVHTQANPGGEIRGQVIATNTPSATAEFEYDPDANTLDYVITPDHLSGAVAAAHLHTGVPGVAGPVALTLDTSLHGSLSNLTDQQVSDLFDGKLYANVHTALNPLDGEIRGQVTITGAAECTCGTGKRSAYLKCIKQKIAALEKSDRKLASVKAIKKAAALGTCGRTKGPKKAIACCLAQTPTENIVLGRQCAAIPDRACTKKGGTSLGTGSSCFPSNPCTPPASPSGAFVDAD